MNEVCFDAPNLLPYKKSPPSREISNPFQFPPDSVVFRLNSARRIRFLHLPNLAPK